MKLLIVFLCLVVATTAESFGDAAIRVGLFERVGLARVLTMLGGAALLFLYGTMVNLAPLPFSRIVGFYIATLFVAWTLVSFVQFKTVPTLPVVVGGSLIVTGGLIVSFWRA